MRSFFIFLLCVVLLPFLGGCHFGPRPQKGGASKTTLGGSSTPSAAELGAPENPQTASTTTLRKKTVREYFPGTVEVFDSRLSGVGNACSRDAGEASAGSSARRPSPALTSPVRETTEEEATTSIGAAQKDTARELGARLGNMRGVQWVGMLLLIGGPIVGFKLGWFTNGLIAGGVGLLLIILSQVLPGNEAWLGLIALLVMPIVAYAYYKAHHDVTTTAAAAPSSTDSK